MNLRNKRSRVVLLVTTKKRVRGRWVVRTKKQKLEEN
jgi:hypothetical protein